MPNMVVKTATDRAVKARRMVKEHYSPIGPARIHRIACRNSALPSSKNRGSRFPAHDILKPD
jgi:hypothetical protein